MNPQLQSQEVTTSEPVPDSSLDSPQKTSHTEPLPKLHAVPPSRRRQVILWTGVTLVTLDLCCLPITYFYALKFDTDLSLQTIFAIITGVYGLISFTHYFFRSLRLFLPKKSPKWRPVGWTKWGIAEFLQVNILIIITLVEIELVAATIPHNPWVRVCAMASPTICFYVGFLFCGTAILTQMRKTLPFNMSSTPKGSLWRPALFAYVEDAGALEGQGGVPYREAIMKRYEVSPRFRRMILILDWMWGVGLLAIAIISTVLIMVLDKNIAFGVGWGLPWAFSAVYALLTVWIVKHHLKREKAEWAMKEVASSNMSAA
ncbi:Uncharacterized protein BP5553_05303 [Venustampulla echinocandica]|uniref:Uncharacterized protein n=1 Tax=Venustampulla echinocandica TaxID=2656787 RepID=A0A370TQS0_9HELO|nr:Uncharacterized protein BP5553_05303 [Venustampulla echinocandica]RDL37870.1 Uncharacterized protein BP5553_05303 [Venustampulla echinocandica]